MHVSGAFDAFLRGYFYTGSESAPEVKHATQNDNATKKTSFYLLVIVLKKLILNFKCSIIFRFFSLPKPGL